MGVAGCSTTTHGTSRGPGARWICVVVERRCRPTGAVVARSPRPARVRPSRKRTMRSQVWPNSWRKGCDADELTLPTVRSQLDAAALHPRPRTQPRYGAPASDMTNPSSEGLSASSRRCGILRKLRTQVRFMSIDLRGLRAELAQSALWKDGLRNRFEKATPRRRGPGRSPRRGDRLA